MLNVLAQISALAAIGGAAIVFLLPWGLQLFTRHDHIADLPFWVLGIDLVSMCASGMMTQFVIASGRNPFPKAVFASGFLATGLLMVLIPRYGLLGAALGQFSANAVTNLWISAWHFGRLASSLEE